MRSILKNKKGMSDIFYILASLFALSFFVYLFLSIGGGFHEKMSEKMAEDEDFSIANETYTELHEKNVRMLDFIYLGVFFTLLFGMLFVSFLIRASPAWIVVFIFLSIFAVICAGALSNYYQAMTEKDAVSDYYNEVPKMNWIMENLVIITICVCALSLIVTYGKSYFYGGIAR